MIKGRRILITGGAGSIGSELVRQLAPKNKIFILDFNETDTFDLSEELSQKGYWVRPRIGDIRNKVTVQDLFEDFKPQIVFHSAAYKHVSPMETYPEEAVQTNIVGTLNVIRESKKWECLERFVYISTDKAISSYSIMGATKRVGEIITKNQGRGFVVVRFGNVLGSRGSVVPIWQRQVNVGEPLTITDPKMERYFMTIPQACELVISAAELGKGGEIFILDMGKRFNVRNVLERLVREGGLDNGIETIGIRPGETLTEKLWLEEERPVKEGKFWIIR